MARHRRFTQSWQRARPRQMSRSEIIQLSGLGREALMEASSVNQRLTTLCLRGIKVCIGAHGRAFHDSAFEFDRRCIAVLADIVRYQFGAHVDGALAGTNKFRCHAAEGRDRP